MTRLFWNSLNLLVLTIALAACSGSSTGSDYCSNDDNCGAGKICKQGACVTGTRSTTGGDTNAGDIDHTDSNTNDGASSDGGDSPGDSTDEGPGDPIISNADFGPIPDITGPLITIESPAAGVLAGEYIDIVAWVGDSQSPVDLTSAKATLGNDITLTLVPAGFSAEDGVKFVQRAHVPDSMRSWTYATIEVTAKDVVGNESSTGHEFGLDTTSPAIAVRNFYVREIRMKEGARECSRRFPILGKSAVAHGQVLASPADPADLYDYGWAFFPRAYIEDHGNAENLDKIVVPIFGVDTDTTKLYILTADGLSAGNTLVAPDLNGTCGINPDVEPDPILPSPEQALVLALNQVPPSGAADFRPLDGPGANCIDGTDDANGDPPGDVCEDANGATVGLSRWKPTYDESQGTVYVITNYDAASLLYCGGGYFDGHNLPGGPLCITAVATDRGGNANVAVPLAICFERSGSDCVGFNADTVPCASGCMYR